MVTTVTSLGRSGLHDWIIQRVSAVVLAAYVIYLLAFCLMTPELTATEWRALFAATWFKVFSLMALLSLVLHAWIGIWTVATDYIKPLAIRMVFQILVILACLAFLIWGAQILWSV